MTVTVEVYGQSRHKLYNLFTLLYFGEVGLYVNDTVY